MTEEELVAISQEHPILFFDGYCALCNNSVKLFLKYDKKKLIRFSSLQSDAAQILLRNKVTHIADSKSLLVLLNNEVFSQTDGIIALQPYTSPPLSFWLKIIAIFPAFLRNWGYSIISKIRYKIWGKTKTLCPIMTPDVRALFLY